MISGELASSFLLFWLKEVNIFCDDSCFSCEFSFEEMIVLSVFTEDFL